MQGTPVVDSLGRELDGSNVDGYHTRTRNDIDDCLLLSYSSQIVVRNIGVGNIAILFTLYYIGYMVATFSSYKTRCFKNATI